MTSDEVIDLVHKIDVLQARRSEMDSQIVSLKRQLDDAVGGSRRVIFARPAQPVSNRRLRESPRMSSAVQHIQENPKADYPSLSQAVYRGKALKDVKNTRTLVFHMKKANMIKGDPGAWRVIQPSDGLEDTSGDLADTDEGSLM